MLKTQFPHASKLIFGCMGLGGNWSHQPYTKADLVLATEAVEQALACNITVFDHADIYTHGNAEKIFAEVLSHQPGWRDNMIIQSKCGIRFADNQGPKRYDFSPEWISASLEGILSRLNIEQLDVFFLHRPDPLADLPAVAECLKRLHQEGKFAQLGVSNMHWYQMQGLNKLLPFPIIANQLEMSLGHRDWLEDGICTNSPLNCNNGYTPGTLEYCQQQQVQLQAWAPLAQGKYSGKSDADEPTSKLVSTLAAHYGVSREAIVLGWLMRHPAGIQPVIGTTNPTRIKACAQATDLTLTRLDWYKLFEAARDQEVP